MPKIKEGFAGQRFMVLPRTIVGQCAKDTFGSHLYVTDIGYFPHAKYHFCKRETPIDDYIMIYCRSGKGWIEIEKQRHELQQNEFIIIPAGVHHAYGANELSPWTIYWVHFNGKYASEFAKGFAKPTPIYSTKSLKITELSNLFELIYETLDSGLSDENIRFATANMYAFLGSITYLSVLRENNQDQKMDLVEQAVEILKEHIDKKITSKDLCQKLNCSSTSLSKKFRDRIGYSPMSYLNNLRIQQACVYLDNTGLSINQISLKVGIDDPYYFSRLFNLVMRMSPSQYRKQQKW